VRGGQEWGGRCSHITLSLLHRWCEMEKTGLVRENVCWNSDVGWFGFFLPQLFEAPSTVTLRFLEERLWFSVDLKRFNSNLLSFLKEVF